MDKIKDLRKAKGLTQTEVSLRTGIERTYLVEIEDYETIIPVHIANILAPLLGVKKINAFRNDQVSGVLNKQLSKLSSMSLHELSTSLESHQFQDNYAQLIDAFNILSQEKLLPSWLEKKTLKLMEKIVGIQEHLNREINEENMFIVDLQD